MSFNRRRSQRDSDGRIFLLSGVDDGDRKILANMIQELGGLYLNTDSFMKNCTHVVCGKLIRSEKFLGACAMGKWVLHPDYIRRSFEEKNWLQEELFEWSNYDTPNYPLDIRTAGSRWRFNKDVFQSFPFSGWNVAVVVSGNKQSSVYKRLLGCGGAHICNLKLPVTDIAKVANTLTYIFVNSKHAANVVHLLEYGVLCLKPEYIGDFLIKDPSPDPMDYLVQCQNETVADQSIVDINCSQQDYSASPNLNTTCSSETPEVKAVPHLPPHIQTTLNVPDTTVRRSKRKLNISSTSSSRSQTPDSEIHAPHKESTDSATSSPCSNAKVLINRLSDGYVQTQPGQYTPSSDQSIESHSPSLNSDIILSQSYDSDMSLKQSNNSTSSPVKNVKNRSKRQSGKYHPSPTEMISHIRTLRSGKSTPSSEQSSRCQTPDSEITGNVSETSSPYQSSLLTKNLAVLSETSSIGLRRSGRNTPCSESSESQSPKFSNRNVRRNMRQRTSTQFSVTEIGISQLANKTETDSCLNTQSPNTNQPFSSHTGIKNKGPRSCSTANPSSDSYIIQTKNLPSCTQSTIDEILSLSQNDYADSLLEEKIDSEMLDNISDKFNRKSKEFQTVENNNKASRQPVLPADEMLSPTIDIQQKEKKTIDFQLRKDLSKDRSSLVQTEAHIPVRRSSKRILQKSQEELKTESLENIPENYKQDGFPSTSYQHDPSEESSVDDVATPNVSTKRKTEDSDNLEYRKKLKVYNDNLHWIPVIGTCYSLSGRMDTDSLEKETPFQISTSQSSIINTCLEETSGVHFMLAGLYELRCSITRKYYPPSSTLHLLMNNILMGPTITEMVANQTFCVLMKLLELHPPTSLVAINLYNESFVYNQDNEYSIGKDWNFIKTVISATLNGDVIRSNGIYLLSYLVAVIEQNYTFTIKQYKEKPNAQKLRSSMLGQLLWASLNQVFFNSRCRELLGFIGNVLVLPVEEEQRLSLLRLLLGLMGMAANICYLVENSTVQKPVNNALFGKNVSVFLHELTRVVNYNLDEALLKEVLMSLQPSWFCLGVCCYFLGDYDDYLLIEGLPTDRITLRDIVSKYFFLLPKMNSQPSMVKSPHKKRMKTTSRPTTPLSSQKFYPQGTPQKTVPLAVASGSTNTPERERNARVSLMKTINKKNYKGETPLHTACIKNDVSKLGQLLKVPGVNVNVQDNAGWTPIHEACNHGRIQCVKELLNFVPAKTVEHYFNKEGPRCKKVDLLISNDEGITPLHDAVVNNRLDICELLLKHAGAVLLKQKTVNDYTPLDLATDPNIKDLLLSYSDEQVLASCSQESSQGQEALPGSYLYEQVLGEGQKQRFSSSDECAKYVSVIIYLINSYVSTTEASYMDIGNDLLAGNKENRSQILSQEEQMARSDLKILRNMKKYLTRFEDHLRKICDSKDSSKLDSILALLMCIQDDYFIVAN